MSMGYDKLNENSVYVRVDPLMIKFDFWVLYIIDFV